MKARASRFSSSMQRQTKVVDPNLTPFQAQVRGLLHDKMNRYDDGGVTILTPKKHPTVEPEDITRIVSLSDASVCAPVEISGIEVTPVEDPYDVGDTITLNAFPTGTSPFLYRWLINGVVMSEEATYVHTLVEGDVVLKDPSGLGVTEISLFVSNPCGMDSTIRTINVQGDPP